VNIFLDRAEEPVRTLEIVAQELNGRTSNGNRAFESVGRLVITELVTNRSQEAILGNDSFITSVEQHEASSTISVLGVTDIEAFLTDKGSLLITKTTSDWNTIKRAALDIAINF
jgi:hypothetical protein